MDVHSQLSQPLSVGEQQRKSFPSNLDVRSDDLDLRLEVIQLEGQTDQQKLTKYTRTTIARDSNCPKFVNQSVIVLIGQMSESADSKSHVSYVSKVLLAKLGNGMAPISSARSISCSASRKVVATCGITVRGSKHGK